MCKQLGRSCWKKKHVPSYQHDEEDYGDTYDRRDDDDYPSDDDYHQHDAYYGNHQDEDDRYDDYY